MKRFNNLLIILLIFSTCIGHTQQSNKGNDEKTTPIFKSYGAHLDAVEGASSLEMSKIYSVMATTDTVPAQFAAKVVEVCQGKGCWMKLQLADGQQTMVRFKDYGFFVPKDITGREVVVNGLAFIQEISADDQKHYAKDAGKPEVEIAKITKTKMAYGFEANGVLLKL